MAGRSGAMPTQLIPFFRMLRFDVGREVGGFSSSIRNQLYIFAGDRKPKPNQFLSYKIESAATGSLERERGKGKENLTEVTLQTGRI